MNIASMKKQTIPFQWGYLINFMKTSLMFFCLLCFVACGMSATDDDQQAKANRNDQKLKEMYAPVVGVYSGQVKLAAGVIGGKIILYLDSIQDGYDSNGAPISHTILKGQLKFNEIGFLDDHTFFVDYKEFDATATFKQDEKQGQTKSGPNTGSGLTGNTSFASTGSSNGSCSVGEQDASLAILNGQFRGQGFKGLLVKKNGPIGEISMVRVEQEAVQPARDQAERLNAAFKSITGTYGGRFKGPPQDSGPYHVPTNFPVKINVFVENVSISEGVRCPILSAEYSRPDILDPLVGVIALRANFYQRESSIEFRSSAESGAKYLSVSAAVPLDGVKGDMRWWNLRGPVELKRCMASAVDFNGNCCKTDLLDVKHRCKN